MEEYGRRLPAELCARTNMEKVVGRAVCMEEYDRRLKADGRIGQNLMDELCAWKNMIEGAGHRGR